MCMRFEDFLQTVGYPGHSSVVFFQVQGQAQTRTGPSFVLCFWETGSLFPTVYS